MAATDGLMFLGEVDFTALGNPAADTYYLGISAADGKLYKKNPDGSVKNIEDSVDISADNEFTGDNSFAKPNAYANETGITAHAGGTQQTSGDSVIDKEVNIITVCATAADSVTFDAAAVAGKKMVVKNNGAAALAVFPFTGGTINSGGANASVTVQPGETKVFSGQNATNWETISADVSLKGDNAFTGANSHAGVETFALPNVYANATTITAFATGGQASATALTKEKNNITTVATAHDSVKLPTAVTGASITVKNSGASDLDIFPATGDSIDALAVNLAVTIAPGSVATFVAKSTDVWESNTDETLTLNAPTTASGQLVVKAANNAGNTKTVVTNDSQAAARTYSVPDAGADAKFVMTSGLAATSLTALAGGAQAGTALSLRYNNFTTVATASDSAQLPVAVLGKVIKVKNSAALPMAVFGQTGDTINGAAANASVLVGAGQEIEFKAISGTAWLTSVAKLMTSPVSTVAIAEYADGRDVTTELTLTNFIVGALAGAAANLAVGNIVAAFPAGQHFELVSALSSIVLTAAGTAVATDTGLGSVQGAGAVATLDGTGTFEDRLTGQTITTGSGGGAAVSALKAATAGIGTGIALNVAASVKNVFLNSAGTFNVDNTGNLTASGKIIIKWTRMN